MSTTFSAYLDAIQAGEALIERVNLSLGAFGLLCKEPIKEIFISDRRNRDTGDRDFSSLWAFTDTFWLSTKNVLTEWNADVAPYKDSIWYLGVTYRDLILNEDRPKSSGLSVEVSAGRIERNELFATNSNCPYLWKIVTERFRPNLRTVLT